LSVGLQRGDYKKTTTILGLKIFQGNFRIHLGQTIRNKKSSQAPWAALGRRHDKRKGWGAWVHILAKKKGKSYSGVEENPPDNEKGGSGGDNSLTWEIPVLEKGRVPVAERASGETKLVPEASGR